MTPRPRMLLLFACTFPILIAGIWMPPLRMLGLFGNLIVIGAALADLFVSESLAKLKLEREVSEVLSVGSRNPVNLIVRNTGKTSVVVDLYDETPQPGSASSNPLTMEVAPMQERIERYTFEPHERGRNSFDSISLRKESTFGLWTFTQQRPLKTKVRILPDIRAVYRYELMARRNRVDELGIKMRRLRGQGSEFERLREYRRDDEMRQIDWKASSRKQELVSREFNVEQNQNILIAVDCGRSMLNESDGVSYLDRALNASIMLSYIALGQADNVGFMAFSNKVERVVRPVRGKPAIQTILQHSFDLQPRRETADYTLAMEQLSQRFRKRSLVILLTHVVDDKHLEELHHALKSIRSRHLFLCVFLQDLGLTNLATKVPTSDVEAFQCSAAAELLTAVEKKTITMKDSGILTMSSLPDKLTSTAINGYLEVKARHLL
ncbi:DUF58 domain-containing protein [Thalassoglobus sp.]|uniref:DUF58 domain-containing protein n=1 Tax=Thalassoglobus sp. TaxID=2795869 RepID=UPI003AA99BC7